MQNFPYHIETEDDLNTYEEYLKENDTDKQTITDEFSTQVICRKENNMSYIPQDNQNLPKSLKNTAFLPAFLSKNIGKLVKIESLIGGKLESRIGILITVGANFIVLRQIRSNNTMICDSSLIKYVTIIHDNDLRKLIP